MKIIFIVLLTLNVAYLFGMQLYSDEKTAPDPTMSLNPEKIVLLSIDENCLEWGSFDEEQLHDAKTTLSEVISDQLYSVEEVGRTIRYWLYIPPLANKEATNRMINKLRNLGIVSFRVKEEGKWKNAISLGMLPDKEDAFKQLKEMEKKGIADVVIEDREVMLKKIVIQNPDQMLKEQMQKVVEQFDGAQLVQSKCESI